MADNDRENRGDENRALNMLLRRRSAVSILPPKPPSLQSPADVAPFEGKTVMLPLCVRIPVAGQMLGVGRTKIYQLINRGELDTIKLDGAVLVTMKSLEQLVQMRVNPRSSSRK